MADSREVAVSRAFQQCGKTRLESPHTYTCTKLEKKTSNGYRVLTHSWVLGFKIFLHPPLLSYTWIRLLPVAFPPVFTPTSPYSVTIFSANTRAVLFPRLFASGDYCPLATIEIGVAAITFNKRCPDYQYKTNRKGFHSKSGYVKTDQNS